MGTSIASRGGTMLSCVERDSLNGNAAVVSQLAVDCDRSEATIASIDGLL